MDQGQAAPAGARGGGGARRGGRRARAGRVPPRRAGGARLRPVDEMAGRGAPALPRQRASDSPAAQLHPRAQPRGGVRPLRLRPRRRRAYARPLALGGALALGVVLVYFWRTPARDQLLLVALALVLGGAVGNLTDRVSGGAVTDFIDVYVGTSHCNTLTVADTTL